MTNKRGRIRRSLSPLRHEHIRSSGVPVIGKIKVGEKREGEKFPRALDYFKASGKYASLFHDEEMYGPKPSVIQVAFISDNIDNVCDERLENRDSKGRLFARGDGETFEVWDARDEAYHTFTTDDYPDIIDRVAKTTGKEWYTTLTLRFLLPKIRGVIGQWQFSTKGVASSIPAIRSAFDFVQETGGTVINVPFDLQVEMVKSQKPGKASTYPVIMLVPNVSTSHLEMLSGFLEAGGDLNRRDVRRGGLLTEARIEEMVPKLLQSTKATDAPPIRKEIIVGDHQPPTVTAHASVRDVRRPEELSPDEMLELFDTDG
jgi:hypothetical protein